MYWNHMTTGSWVLMSLASVIFWALVVFALYSVIVELRDRRSTRTGGSTRSEPLERRLAAGEITIDDYRQIQTTIAKPARQPRDEPHPPAAPTRA